MNDPVRPPEAARPSARPQSGGSLAELLVPVLGLLLVISWASFNFSAVAVEHFAVPQSRQVEHAAFVIAPCICLFLVAIGVLCLAWALVCRWWDRVRAGVADTVSQIGHGLHSCLNWFLEASLPLCVRDMLRSLGEQPWLLAWVVASLGLTLAVLGWLAAAFGAAAAVAFPVVLPVAGLLVRMAAGLLCRHRGTVLTVLGAALCGALVVLVVRGDIAAPSRVAKIQEEMQSSRKQRRALLERLKEERRQTEERLMEQLRQFDEKKEQRLRELTGEASKP